MENNKKDFVISMKDIIKVYPNGVVANKDVNLNLVEGEIHALMGENGAGKSTLMKILFGIEQPTEGEIYLRGEKIKIESPMHAISLGIGMVHQHFMLDEHLTVAENIILGMEPKKGMAIDYKAAYDMVQEYSDKYRFNLNPKTMVSELEVGKKQKVEILKALIRGAKIIIMDEPTAVLTPQETEELFEQLLLLRDNGHTIIFISHKLNEIKEICENATILRNGTTVGSFQVENVSIQELSKHMVGRDVELTITKPPINRGEKVLEVKDLNFVDNELTVKVDNISFAVHRGEILGIAGVEGNGQRELIDCVAGLSNPQSGEILIKGDAVSYNNPTLDRRQRGVAHIPEDRLTYGSMPDSSIVENIISNIYKKEEYNKGIFLDYDKLNETTERLIKEFEVKTDSRNTPVRMLSGGNIQKVVAAREMDLDMDLLIADQPTRGIDVGTAALIREKIVEKRNNGVGVLVVSADIGEVMELSDSLIVFYDGKISAYFKDASQVTEEELGLYMLGLKFMNEEELKGAIS